MVGNHAEAATGLEQGRDLPERNLQVFQLPVDRDPERLERSGRGVYALPPGREGTFDRRGQIERRMKTVLVAGSDDVTRYLSAVALFSEFLENSGDLFFIERGQYIFDPPGGAIPVFNRKSDFFLSVSRPGFYVLFEE